MRATVLLSLVLFGAAIVAGYAYRSSLGVDTRAVQGARIEFDQQVDFGPREQGSIAVAPVVVHNRGDEPLVLSEVRSDCSCSGLEQEIGGRLTRFTSVEIAPGTSATLTSRLIVRGQPGMPESHTVWFRTNDPAMPEAAVRLGVSIVIGVSVSPIELQLGDVFIGRSNEQAIEIRQTGGQKVVLDQVISSDPDVIRCDLIPPPLGEGNLIGSCRVTVTPLATGLRSGQVTIRYRRDGTAHDAVVPVAFRGAPVVELYPSLVRLPLRSNNGPVYQTTVLCRSHRGSPFTLSVDEVPAGVTVKNASARASVEVITITLDPHAAAGGSGKLQTIRLTAKQDGEKIPLSLSIERLP